MKLHDMIRLVFMGFLCWQIVQGSELFIRAALVLVLVGNELDGLDKLLRNGKA